MAAPVRLEELSWPQIDALVQAGESLCLLPIGAIEQHGRHLPCATDTLFVEAVCREASARTAVPLAPTISVSSSHAHTTKWPGTFSLPPRVLIEVVCEFARWVRASGFTKLLLVNSHGGNPGALRVAVDEIRRAGELQVGCIHTFALTPDITTQFERDASDWHANRAETSLMLHLRPEFVDRSAIHDDPDRTIGRIFSYPVAQTSIDGLTGSPSEGTAVEGAALFEQMVEALCGVVIAARTEGYPDVEAAQNDVVGTQRRDRR